MSLLWLVLGVMVVSLFVGCQPTKEVMPPLPSGASTKMRTSLARPVVQELPKQVNYIVLNYTNIGPWSGVTGLVASTDLSNWTEVTNMPYTEGSVTITISNTPPVVFYRAFNR